jgi:crotonobetainyl-CoA:carnitine CoA-transferase CaiB-like acyl-CoA transferase
MALASPRPSASSGREQDKPLTGIRMLELAVLHAAPVAGKLLADYGVDVVHVEDPGAGDPGRSMPPLKNGVGIFFARINAGKRSVAIDLRREAGRALVRDLVSRFDVFLSNLRPTRLEEWGLDYATLKEANPGLVVANVSGFGHASSERDRPGFGTLADALSGFAYTNGWPETPPTAAPFGLGDSTAAMGAAIGILVALVARERTGNGEQVDVALYEPLLNVMGDELIRWTALGTERGRIGNAGDSASPRGIFQSSDGHWLVITAASKGPALRLLRLMGRADLAEDPAYATNEGRVAHDDELVALVTEWAARHTRDELLTILEEAEVPVAPANSPADVAASGFMAERGSLVTLHDGVVGDVLVPGRVARLASLAHEDYRAAPQLGEHTDQVLREELGLSDDALEDLRAEGVIESFAARP